MNDFKRGDLIVFKTHPFNFENSNIKISAFPDYTSPILVIKEVKEKSFEKETGRDNGQQLNCMYYNSRDGKFTEKWISSLLINKITFSTTNHKILDDIDLKKELVKLKKELINKNYENLITTKYLNKKVVLKSVDIELSKIKINRTKENGELLETNHLEFLPPVMTIIGFKHSDEKHKFCEKTGLPLIELKCKWYNSNSKSFSESFFNYEILYTITETQDLIFDKDLLTESVKSIEENTFVIFPLQKSFVLEGDSKNTKIVSTIGQSDSILFKHYFYQMNYFDQVAQKKSTINIDRVFDTKKETEIYGEKFPNYKKGYKTETFECKFKTSYYYQIVYKDSFRNISKRIIKINELFLYIKDIKKFKETYKELESWDYEEKKSTINYNYHENGKIFINSENNSISNLYPY